MAEDGSYASGSAAAAAASAAQHAAQQALKYPPEISDHYCTAREARAGRSAAGRDRIRGNTSLQTMGKTYWQYYCGSKSLMEKMRAGVGIEEGWEVGKQACEASEGGGVARD